MELPVGSRFAFYSDGITEAENQTNEEYGLARLQEHLIREDASAESLLERFFRHLAGRHLGRRASAPKSLRHISKNLAQVLDHANHYILRSADLIPFVVPIFGRRLHVFTNAGPSGGIF